MKTLPAAIIIMALFGASTGSMAQNPVWDQWDPAVIDRANTAADLEYLTEEEKKVILFMNLARLDGKLFGETFLTEYIESNNTDKTSYVRSLYRDLRRLDPLHPLIPEKDLTAIAQGHANQSGKTGHMGHKNFQKRFKPVMGNPYNHVGENCSYGFDRAIDIVITLLIDEGVKNLGHRENILSEDFNSVGVAIRPHKRLRYNCVIDFGTRNRSGLNEIPG